MKSSGVKRLLERALWEQGIRQPLENGKKRHEWKAAHGFRKFYETTANTAMRSINVAWTMGHSIGISESYYKPTEDEVLKDYLNAVPKLTINSESEILNDELDKLRQSTVDNIYMVRSKLEEKDNQIASLNIKVKELKSLADRLHIIQSKNEQDMKTMKEQVTSLGPELQSLVTTMANSDISVRNELAKQLIKSGVFKPHPEFD
jgi:hypothetical protein